MRQAGRYLPEYREIRAKSKNFLNMCLTPELATEITLQPIRRFGMDAAILFADILLVPLAMGRPLEFREGEGPVLEPLMAHDLSEPLQYDAETVSAVFETVRRVKNELLPTIALIGFCGAPWTVACYMIDGHSKNDFAETKKWAEQRPEKLNLLIENLVDVSEKYLSGQIDAGAEVIQIFDSWAGILSPQHFERFVVGPTRQLVHRLKKKYPKLPIIGFPREASVNYDLYARETGVDAMSIDPHVDAATAKKLQEITVLQGNLDPALLVKGGKEMTDALAALLNNLGPIHIANLGHGVVPQTPPEHVAAMVNFVQGFPI
jgi:uroporphyrinogen decarboxylase